MNGEAKALLKVWSIVLASLCYCFFISSKIPKGKLRLFSLLPIFTLFTLLPLSLSSVLPAGITAFFVTWLANSKLLLFSFDLGPLSDVCSFTPRSGDQKPIRSKSSSLLRFFIIAAFPIKITHPSTQNQKPTKILPLNFWSETLIFSILVVICDVYKNKLHPGGIFVIYCCILYLFLDVVMGISNMLVGSIMGVELSPPSDEPYLSTSLQDFWGKRWNLMVTDALRHTVYKPTRVFLSKYLGEWAPLPAVMTAFLASALMHELTFYYMTRVSPTWEVTWFFVLHGLCVVLEVCLKKVLGRRLRLHWAVTGPIAVGFVMGTGYRWFFPQLVRNQTDVRAIEEVKALFEFIKGMFKLRS